MKTTHEAEEVDGVVVCKHEIEVLCSNCNDPVSEHEEATGTCTNCGEPWQPRQSTSIWATSVPAAGVKTLGE